MVAQRLQLKLKQQLSLAPQLQQAIKLLQLNRLELKDYLQQALEENPLLEYQDLGAESAGDADTEADAATDEYLEDPLAGEWDDADGFSITGSGDFSAGDRQDQWADTGSDSLQTHLLWQINLTPLSATDEAIAQAIVFALNEDGYLLDSVDDIRNSLAPDILVEADEVTAVLHRLQRMEPVGVATRSPAECLAVQLETMSVDTPHRHSALQIASKHMHLLEKGDRRKLAQVIGVDRDEISQAISLLQSLEPRPGARYDNRHNEYLVPDVYLRQHEGDWVASLSPDSHPNIRLNGYYVSLMRSVKGDDKGYLKGRLQEARWLLNSLELRNRTLLAVSNQIAQHQSGFLERGEKFMQPLILKEIAAATGLHESTVSRATTRKYALTPRGLFELKYFFSSHVRTLDGRAISATAVKAYIQEIIGREAPASPLSDQALSDKLREHGIRVARRTVAKYRESLGILSSTQRRRAAKLQTDSYRAESAE